MSADMQRERDRRSWEEEEEHERAREGEAETKRQRQKEVNWPGTYALHPSLLAVCSGAAGAALRMLCRRKNMLHT